MTIVHRTYTPFDMRAVTITGLSAKPTPGIDAIGKFGTGLKYALAVLIREGCSVTILTPGERHKIVSQAKEFRGQPYEALLMRSWATGADLKKSARPRRTELPFTTHYGSNWEMWMAFRELHSNTLDEGGFTERFQDKIPDEHTHISEGCAILVDGEAYEREYYARHRTFLDAGPVVRYEGGGVKIYDRPHDDYANTNKYYRGLRAGNMQGDLMSLFIYDCTGEVYLSEERQVSDYYWDWRVCSAIAESDDEDLIKQVLEADDDWWESSLNFHPSMPVSEAFMKVAAVAKVNSRHYEYVKSKRPESIKELSVDKYPTPWHMTDYAILSASDAVVATRPGDMTPAVFRGIWTDRVSAINTHAPTVFGPVDKKYCEICEDVGSCGYCSLSGTAGPDYPAPRADAPGADEAPAGPADGAEAPAEPVFLTEPVEVEGSYAQGAALLDEVRKDFDPDMPF